MSFDDEITKNIIDGILDLAPSSLRRGIPDLKIESSSNNTKLINFREIMSILKRDDRHFMKFISSKLGVKTTLNGNSLVINATLNKEKIRKTFETYIEDFIICKFCGKPDTIMKIKSKKNIELQCLACGKVAKL